MSDSTTYILLAAAVLTAGGVYMFDRNAKARYHSQPAFTQMNKPGTFFKAPTASTQTDTSFKPSHSDASVAGSVIYSGKTFLG